MKVAIYARESSSDVNKAPPIERQIEIGKEWIANNNHELGQIFADDGFSGGDWTRPDWLKSINEAKRHSYNILWVWNQDRIARDTEQFLFYYRNLKEGYAKIYDNTLANFIDMETLGGRVQHTSLAQAAEIFRLVTSEKVKSKYKAKKEKEKDNFKWGRPRISVDAQKIKQLKAEGKGYRTIAKELGYNYQTVRRCCLTVTK